MAVNRVHDDNVVWPIGFEEFRRDDLLTSSSRAVNQGGQVRAEVDAAVVPALRRQRGADSTLRAGVQPRELST